MQMTIHGTHREPAIPLLIGISPTGNRIRWEVIHLFRVSGGQVVEHFAVLDDLGLLRQLHGAGRAKGVPVFAPS
jgi:predicted ester cyclase